MGKGGLMTDLKAIWKNLLAFYQPHPKPTEEFYNTWVKEMSQFQLADVISGSEHLKRWEPKFPTINKMWITVDSIKINREKAEWDKIKQKEKFQSDAFWAGKKADTYGQKALRLISALLIGDITRGNYISGMRDMGMIQDADNMEKFYADNNFELNYPARTPRRNK